MTSEGSQVVLEIIKFGEVDENISVLLSTDSGTATGWHTNNLSKELHNYNVIYFLELIDFIPRSLTLDFPPNVTTMNVTVDIIADDITEAGSGEIFFAKLRSETNSVRVNITEDLATITIIMDDPSKII